MNDWILYGWWPGLLGFAKMVAFSFWWLLAIGVVVLVIYLCVLLVVIAND